LTELDFFSNAKHRTAAERVAHLQREVSAPPSGNFISYGFDYYDNPASGRGYGGYHYDGRYAGVAQKMIEHYGLQPGSRILEVGCAKGYVLVEFKRLGMDVRGLEYSAYAIEHAHPELSGNIVQGSATQLPFEKGFFDLVLCKEMLPHLDEADVGFALQEMARVSRAGRIFLEIQCAEDAHGAALCVEWDPTHRCIRSPAWWLAVFQREQYVGDYHFKILF
jgi:2-polyprenyl-3-methyl-5-hydroxy-6-metoxy-1,4-benzoquinol methylase